MRIKISGEIIEEGEVGEVNSNQIYAMILSNLTIDRAKELHEKKKVKRKFTYSKIYIKEKNITLYVSGMKNFIEELKEHLNFNQLIRLGERVIKITKIEDFQENLVKKNKYIFKSDFIVNEMENGKVSLSKDFDYIKKRINNIAKDKYKEIYDIEINENIELDILKVKNVYAPYKNHHLNSYKMVFSLRGSYELINLLYKVGLGENTSSGHGMMWEV